MLLYIAQNLLLLCIGVIAVRRLLFCDKLNRGMIIVIVKIRQRNFKGVLRNSDFRLDVAVFIECKNSPDTCTVRFVVYSLYSL